MTSDRKATLAQAPEKLKDGANIHPALEKGFSAIYGFTSDSRDKTHSGRCRYTTVTR